MKKSLLIVLYFLSVCNFLSAQELTGMIGFSASYDYFEYRSIYSGDIRNKGINFGFEYSEIKGRFGYRAGINYSRVKDYIIYPNSTLLIIDIFILPTPSTLEMMDFPLSGQLYLGKKKLKCYVNAGFINTLSILNEIDEEYFYYTEENKSNKSISIRSMFGAGLTYQFSKHFGIDIGANKKDLLYTFNDSYIKPLNSFGIQTKVNYIF